MPAPDASNNSRVETPVVANVGRSSRLKAPVVPNAHKSSRFKAPGLPDQPKNSRIKVLAAPKVLNLRDFVCIQALPGIAQKEGKVLTRSRTIYRSSEPPREQVYWENYHRRQKQFTQGLFTPFGKPYRELGEILYTDPKKLTLYALGQLAQEPVKKDVQEKPPKEVAEATTNKYSFKPESDPSDPAKRLSSFRETGKELKTLHEALARSRCHINSVKHGGEYFHILHQESLERKNTPRADQQARSTRWRTKFQLCKQTSNAEEAEEEINTCSLTEGNHLREREKKEKMTLRSFTPVYTSVLIPNPPGAKSDRLFRQLCAIHWLLKALTLKSNGSMRSISTCWNPKDPGGCKKTVKEIEEEKLGMYMWEVLVTNTKKCIWKPWYSPISRKRNKTPTPGVSQLSSWSSPRGQTPCSSETTTLFCSEDNVKTNVASSDGMSGSAQAKEQPLFSSLQKVIRIIREKVSKDVHKHADVVKKAGLQQYVSSLPVAQNYGVNMPFIKDQESTISKKQSCHISSFTESKSNLCADMRQKFMAIREEAACHLHDTLESLESTQEERCFQKYQALKQLKYFERDMKRMRRLDVTAKSECDEDGLNWFSVLLARLPESVKSDHYVQKILKKLEKYGKTPDLKIHPDTFLKALDNLQVRELCSPEIAAAVEFVRESIVQMPEEDFSEWFQTKVHSPPPLNQTAR